MNERKDNNQALNEYLLGTLSDAETQRFDELCCTDEEFHLSLKSAEQDLVDAYVHGELTGRTLERFKSHYLASPLRREKVEFARAFQNYAEGRIAKAADTAAAPAPHPKQMVRGFFSAINVFKNPSSMWQWGFAGLVLALVFVGGWWMVNQRWGQQQDNAPQAKQAAPAPSDQAVSQPTAKERLENPDTSQEVATADPEREPAPLKDGSAPTSTEPLAGKTRTPEPEKPARPPRTAIASFILAPPLRGMAQVTSLSIPQNTEVVAMRLQLEADDYAAYRVALVNQAGVKLWRSGTLKTDTRGGNKVLNLRFPAKLLESQVYTLSVSGITRDGAAEIIADYPFRSVLQ